MKIRQAGSDANSIFMDFDSSQETGAAQYGDMRPWELAAHTSAFILMQLPGYSCYLECNEYTEAHRKASTAYGNVVWTTISPGERLTGDHTIWITDSGGAIFLPVYRENLEAASFLAGDRGIAVVHGLEKQHSDWAKSGLSDVDEVRNYVARHTACWVRGSYDGVEIQDITSDVHANCEAAARLTELFWNGELV